MIQNVCPEDEFSVCMLNIFSVIDSYFLYLKQFLIEFLACMQNFSQNACEQNKMQ